MVEWVIVCFAVLIMAIGFKAGFTMSLKKHVCNVIFSSAIGTNKPFGALFGLHVEWTTESGGARVGCWRTNELDGSTVELYF